MCLTTVARTIPKKVKETEFAWKVFHLNSQGVLSPEFYVYHPHHSFYEVEEWYTARGCDDMIQDNREFPYPYGFHCFLRKKDARIWDFGERTRVRRVQVRNVVAFGKQGGALVLVAREMRILPKEETSLITRLISKLRRLFKGGRA